MRLRATVLAVSATAVLLIAPALRAQQMEKLKNTTPEERAKAQTAMMTSRLGLSAEQTPRIAEINRKYAEKMEPLIKGTEGPLVKMRQMRELNEQKEGELKQVLSPEQFQKYLASKDAMREQFMQRMQEKRGGGQ